VKTSPEMHNHSSLKLRVANNEKQQQQRQRKQQQTMNEKATEINT